MCPDLYTIVPLRRCLYGDASSRGNVPGRSAVACMLASSANELIDYTNNDILIRRNYSSWSLCVNMRVIGSKLQDIFLFFVSIGVVHLPYILITSSPLSSCYIRSESLTYHVGKLSSICERSNQSDRFKVIMNINFSNMKVISIRVNRSISITKLMRLIRKIGQFSKDTAIYLFHNNIQVTEQMLGIMDKIDVECIGENRFGQVDSSDDSKNKTYENSKNDNNHKKKEDTYIVKTAYSNTRGTSDEKLTAIRLETCDDRDFMGTELNMKDCDVNRLTKDLGCWATISSGDNYTYRKGKRALPGGGSKKQSYGTGAVTKQANCLSKYVCLEGSDELHFEILALEGSLSNQCKEGRIVVYRSPSMKDALEIESFYERVERYIKHMKDSKRFKCITYIGDSNKSSSPKAARLEKSVMLKYGLLNLIGSQATRVDPKTSRETQPDSCYCWHDPSVVSVTATVNGRIHEKMDHRMIRMKYVLKGTEPKKRVFEEFERKIRNKKISDAEVKAKLNNELANWFMKYQPYVFRKVITGGRVSWTEWPDVANIQISPEVVDVAVEELYECIAVVREWMSTTIKLKYPTTIPRTANGQEVKIGMLSALLGEFSAKIQASPSNIKLREKFAKIEKEKTDLTKKVSREHLESKMKYMCEGVQRSSKDFFLK